MVKQGYSGGGIEMLPRTSATEVEKSVINTRGVVLNLKEKVYITSLPDWGSIRNYLHPGAF
jgi:hypothetical protein